MPPSGYSPTQSDHLGSFLSSCAEALEAECRAAGRSAMEGLTKECNDIEGALGNGWDDPMSEHVLRFTKAFYEAVRARSPRDFDEFRESVEDVISDIRVSVLAVHI